MTKEYLLIKITILILIFSLFPTCIVLSQTERINVIAIEDDIINPAVSEYITKAIEKTEKSKSQALIVKLDTPGGLLSSTRNVVKEIMTDRIPVIVYVSPKGARAASAGTFITLSSHIAVMAPSTHIGAAHPVTMGGGSSFKRKIERRLEKGDEQDKEFKPANTMEEKILNDTMAWIKNIAEERDRNIEWAQKAVTESVSITEKEAVRLDVIDFVAEDVHEILEKVDGIKIKLKDGIKTLHTKDAEIVNIEMSLRQKILNTVSHPNVAYILMILGFYALLFEITHPGFGVPGIAGMISLILAFYAFQVLPVNYAGVGLIVLSMIFFAAEAFTPTFGLFIVGGIICMFLGSLILIDSPREFMQISIKIILPVVIATGGISLFLIGNVLKTRRTKISSGKEALVGEIGEALTKVTSGEGKVFIHGEIWNAIGESDEVIKKGKRVKVIKVEGLKLVVARITTNE